MDPEELEQIFSWVVGGIDIIIGLFAIARFYRFVQYENQQIKIAGTHRITRNYNLKKTFHITIVLAMFSKKKKIVNFSANSQYAEVTSYLVVSCTPMI